MADPTIEAERLSAKRARNRERMRVLRLDPVFREKEHDRAKKYREERGAQLRARRHELRQLNLDSARAKDRDKAKKRRLVLKKRQEAMSSEQIEALRIKARKRRKAWRDSNPTKARASERRREAKRKEAKEVARRANRHLQNERYANDLVFKLCLRLRGRIVDAMRRRSKAGSAVRDLGCSIEEFRRHIERQFTKGMTWDNWGRGTGKWHLDHITPLALFNLTDPEQFRQAAHFTNYRPLWQDENIRKSGKRTLLL